MIEFDTQIIPTARAMSFLFSGRVQLSKCAKNFTLPAQLAQLAIISSSALAIGLTRAFGSPFLIERDSLTVRNKRKVRQEAFAWLQRCILAGE